MTASLLFTRAAALPLCCAQRQTTGNQAATQVLLAAGAGAPFARTSSNGFTGGGQIGYNYEIAGPGFASLPRLGGGSAALVVGIEGDAAYTDARTSGAFTSLGVVNNAFSTRTEYVGTARGRLGVALGTLLAYGTAGFAYGGVRDNFSTSVGGVTAFAGGRDRACAADRFRAGNLAVRCLSRRAVLSSHRPLPRPPMQTNCRFARSPQARRS